MVATCVGAKSRAGSCGTVVVVGTVVVDVGAGPAGSAAGSVLPESADEAGCDDAPAGARVSDAVSCSTKTTTATKAATSAIPA